ncbi:MAG: SRPBCC family protein [Verrucomicrobiales bacterium]|nr:SRPBCC family protein [Verrucomicrobiales bacterium]
MSTVDVSSEIMIERPREVVANFSANPDNASAWYANIKSVEWRTSPPLQIGSQIAFVAHFLGRRMAYTYEIKEFVPLERLVMRTAEGPFPMETFYGWKSLDSAKTRMTLRNRGFPTGFSSLLAPFMSMAVRRANQKDLARLKQLLEHPTDGESSV